MKDRLRYAFSLQRDGALRAGTRPFRQHCRERWARFTARRARRRSNSTFIGVTGSSAKSTTTCLLGHILEGHGSVYLQARRNTILPVTSTAKAGKESVDYVVSELGVAQLGDMQSMSGILQPDVAIVTLIGLDHKSAFRTREAIAREKGALVEAIRPGGFALLNADDDLVMAMADRTDARIVTFGRSRDADYRVVSATSSYPDPLSVEIVRLGGRIRIRTRLLGEHFWLSVVAAVAAATELGVPFETIQERCATFQPVQNRCTPFETDSGPVFILDAAKAPWEALPLALRVIENAVAPRKRVVLGHISDYFGDPNPKYRDAFRAARSVSDQVIFAGENAHRSKASQEDRESGRFIELRTAREVHEHIEKTAVRGEVILLKSSRNLHLERVALAWKHEVRCWIDRCGLPKDCFDCGLYETPFEEHERILRERAATARRSRWQKRLTRLMPWPHLRFANGHRR
jgi:UDP-N-acetylmuramoyl-tripeptide--D-alanyl-D-alanine ligase